MKKYYTVIHFVCLFSFFGAYAQTSSENYVLSRTYRFKEGAVKSSTDNSKYWGNVDSVQTQVSYMDGLGKEKQVVSVFGAPDKKDLVVKTEYDNMYRPWKNYLPVAQTSQTGGIHGSISDGFCTNGNNVSGTTSAIWTETLYDDSPLGRVKEQKAPGVGTGVRKWYKVNVLSDSIRKYKIDDFTLKQGGHYENGALSYIVTLDEENREVKEFVDRNGHVIAKRIAGTMTTYYIYDMKGLLRYVLQPAYQDATGTQTSKLDRYAFQYSYDSQGRMISKRIPGQAVAITMEYDGRDRLTYMTDAKGQKFYYKYEDNLNRQTEMGLGTIGSGETPIFYYQYDNYDGTGFSFDNEFSLIQTDHFLGEPQNWFNSKGRLTRTRARVLESNGTYGSDWLETVNFYDYKGRVIQVQRKLYGVGGGATEKTSYKLDFLGNVVAERVTQSTSGGTYRLDKVYTYDHQSRLKSIAHTFYHNGTEKKNYTHVANSYNEVGLLSRKELQNATQKQNYKYTPRSWMASTTNDGGKTFALGLSYNSNGNINNLSWQTHTQGARSFSLSYDGANRLEAATGSLQENISYDKNGNITSLSRGGGTIDNLTYDYGSSTDNKSNLLKGVSDSGTSEGFDNNGTSTNEDYTYDNNGNLTKDLNKKVSAINYNVLNLPREVTLTDPARTVQYVYDASGAKLKTANPGGTTFYAGAFEYNSSGILQRIALEEGQLVKNGDNYDVNYYLKDHLGNVRIVLKEDGTVLQETEYYPFGLAVYKNGNDAQNKYLYNEKEKQPETGWLDYGARMYDPTIGRFFTVDRFSEKYLDLTPYQYAGNNPILNIDVNGDSLKVSSTITEDKELNAVYNDFSSSKEGRKFLLDYAAAGQKIGDYTVTKDGKYHRRGIDLNYSAEKLDSKTGGETSTSMNGSRAQINIALNNLRRIKDFNKSVMDKVVTFTHESFIHANLSTKDFLDDRKFNGSNISQEAKRDATYPEHFQHFQVANDYRDKGYDSGNLWPLNAYNLIKEVNQKRGVFPSNNHIIQRMWDYSGGVTLDLNGNVIKK